MEPSAAARSAPLRRTSRSRRRGASRRGARSTGPPTPGTTPSASASATWRAVPAQRSGGSSGGVRSQSRQGTVTSFARWCAPSLVLRVSTQAQIHLQLCMITSCLDFGSREASRPTCWKRGRQPATRRSRFQSSGITFSNTLHVCKLLSPRQGRSKSKSCELVCTLSGQAASWKHCDSGRSAYLQPNSHGIHRTHSPHNTERRCWQ